MKTKMVEFKGTLAEFLQGMAEGKDFYTRDSGHAYRIDVDSSIKTLCQMYTSQPIFHRVERTWEDVVNDGGKVLCRISEDLKSILLIDDLIKIELDKLDTPVVPVTLEEIEEFIL